MEFHEVANIFPLMKGNEYKAFVESIRKKNGLEFPIIVHQNKIIDGRNRYRACKELNIKPWYEEWNGNGTLVSFVINANLQRRHLTPSQSAACALDALPYYEKEARKRQSTSTGGAKPQLSQKIDEAEKGRATEHAAKQFGTNRQYVSVAKKIKSENPKLFDEVKTGQKTITQAKREIIKREVKKCPQLEGKYCIIYADPPWRYEFSKTISRDIENQYPTMELEEIKSLPVQNVCADDCILFLWTTSPKLEESLQVLKYWGFKYNTCAVWDKQTIGMGFYFRQQHELLLVGKKGNLPVPRPENRISSVISSPRQKHSQKPEIVYEIIEKMYPEYSKIELFSRNKRNGWTSWGNELS